MNGEDVVLDDERAHPLRPPGWRHALAAWRPRCGHCNTIQVAVFIALYCDYVLNSMGVPILPTFLAKLEVSEKYIGVLFASKPAVQIVANAFAGPMVDRGVAKHTLLQGLAVLAVSTAVFGVGLSLKMGPRVTYGFLLTARCVQGLSSAFIMSAGMTWIARTHNSATRGLVMGFVLVGIGAGAVSGATFGGVLASILGNASPFFVVTMLLLLDAVLITSDTRQEVRETAPKDDVEQPALGEKKSEWQQMVVLFNDPNIACINVLLFVGNCGMTLLQPTLPLYVHNSLGYAQFGQGMVWGAMTLTYLVSRPASGCLAEKLTKSVVITCGVSFLTCGLLIIGSVPLLWVVLAGTSCIGVGVAFITTPCMPLLADVVELQGGSGYGVVYSMADVATSLGMIMGPLIGSLLGGWLPFRMTCQLGALLCFSSVLCSTHLKNLTRTPRLE